MDKHVATSVPLSSALKLSARAISCLEAQLDKALGDLWVLSGDTFFLFFS